MNNLQDKLLQKIKTGEIDMKPKWYFVLQAGLLLTGIILVALLVVYLFSFVLYFMHQSGILFAPAFGFRGLSFFVMSSPWILTSTSIAFLVLLHILVRQYSFSYKQPLLYTMIGVVLVALLGSWIIGQTPAHQRISSFMERHNVPVFAPMYKNANERRPEGLVVGTVIGLTDTGFSIDSRRDGEVAVVVTPRTRMKPGTNIETGAQFMVFGEKDGYTITAFGIRPHDEMQMKQPQRLRGGGGNIRPPRQ